MGAKSQTASGFGAYGKIPALGDFLRIGLTPGFTRAWDTWLQSAMTMAREDLGARWSDCYMSAPIWRFTLPDGVAGGAPVLGVMMPSVDRVGRQFPLTLATALPSGTNPVATHHGAEASFDALETIALGALDDDCTPEALSHALAEVPDVVGATTTQGKGPLGLWSCIWNEEQHQMSTKGWPTRQQIIGLMNPEDEQWTVAISQGGAR